MEWNSKEIETSYVTILVIWFKIHDFQEEKKIARAKNRKAKAQAEP